MTRRKQTDKPVLKPRPLRARLSLAFAAVAALAVLLVTLLVNWFLVNRFAAYVQENLRNRAQQVASSLEASYRREGGWNSTAVTQLAHLSMLEGLRIELRDADGRCVCRSDINMSRMMREMGAPDPSMGTPRFPAPWLGGFDGPQQPFTVTMPLLLDGRLIGTLVVQAAAGQGIFTAHDLHFVQQTNQLLAVAAVFAAAVALLIGWRVSRKLSAPLQHMTAAARRMSAGDLTARVPTASDGGRAAPAGGAALSGIAAAAELQELAGALNHLAESLQQQEQLRRVLTADVAHELRTPLATLRSHLEAYLDGVWQPSPERLVDTHAAAMRLVRLVDDLEQLARAESAAFTLARRPVRAAQLAQEAARGMEALFAERGITLTVEVAEPPGEGQPAAHGRDWISADPDLMHQVLGNLLSNALKYTTARGRVTIGVTPAGGEVRIWVRDTGPGIPAEEMPFIFERFYRGDKSRTRATGGAGIGLAIARALVQAHGGRIEVESRVGEGSTFSVVLPELACPPPGHS